MRFGLFSLLTQRDRHGGQRILDDTVEMVRLADAVDFETAWLAEHHFSNYSMCVSPLVVAANLAAVTRRIKLGTGVLVLPLYHPVRMIEEIGLVDMLSNGRVVVGVGTGYQGYEFDRFGVPLSERTERSLEILDIMDLAFGCDSFSYVGKHFSVAETPLCTRPIGNRRPEIFMASGSPEMLRRSFASGYKPFLSVGAGSTRDLVKLREHVASVAGDGAEPPQLAIQRYVYVTDSRPDALDAAARILYVLRLAQSLRVGNQHMSGPLLDEMPFEGELTPEQILDNVIIGDAHHCAQRVVEEARAVRPVHFSCFMQFGGMDSRRSIRSLETFAGQVVPLVEKELGVDTRTGLPRTVPRVA